MTTVVCEILLVINTIQLEKQALTERIKVKHKAEQMAITNAKPPLDLHTMFFDMLLPMCTWESVYFHAEVDWIWEWYIVIVTLTCKYFLWEN